jgi:hypothetical protein
LSLTIDDISRFFTQQLLFNNNTDRITLASYQENIAENDEKTLQHNESIEKKLKNCQRKY